MTKKLVIECEDFDTAEIELALNAGKYKSALFDLDQWLRSQIKYTDIEKMDLQEVRDKLWEIIRENEVTLGE